MKHEEELEDRDNLAYEINRAAHYRRDRASRQNRSTKRRRTQASRKVNCGMGSRRNKRWGW